MKTTQIEGRKWEYTALSVLKYMWSGKHYLKIDCAKLKMYTINPKAITSFYKRAITNKQKQK